MSHKQSRQTKPHHRPHRRSYQPLPSKSPHRRRGRSQSKPSRARSSSSRLHSRTIPPPRFHSRSRSRPRRAVHPRDIPFYVPPSGQYEHSIPNIIADALRKQDEEQNEALTATNLGYRPLTPPPDPDVPGVAMAPAPVPTPGLKRRPSSSPAAAKARRPRRRRPRPRTQSVMSDPEEPIPPPRPQPAPFYPPRSVSPPYSFFGIIRTKAEREKREKEAKKKKEKREQRRRKQEVGGAKLSQNGDEAVNSPKKAKGFGTEEPSKPPSLRANSAPPLSRTPVQEGRHNDQLSSGSQRGYQPHPKHGKQRHKKHHRRLGEQHHRRKKRRGRYGMRDFFASLRRKLGNLLRLTLPAASSAAQSAPPRTEVGSSTPVRDASGAQHYIDGSNLGGVRSSQQNRGRKRGVMEQPLPYFMHGGRSPANSWHSRLSRPRSRRRFTATVESAPGSGVPSPRMPGEEFPSVAQAVGGVDPQRLSYHTGSAISIIARRFMGPFLSEPSDPSTLDNGLVQRRLSWRSHKLLTAGSRPATPPSSRNPSPGDRGRSRDRSQRASMPGAYRSLSSSSIGPRSLYPDRRSRSASPYRISSPVPSPVQPPAQSPAQSPVQPLARSSAQSPVSSPASPPVPSSPDYGMAELFATPRSAGSPISASPVRISSPDYSLPRFFTSSPVSSGSNFGLRRLFGD